MTENKIDMEAAKKEAEHLGSEALVEKVKTKMGGSLAKFAEKNLRKGKSEFWITKKIAQVAKPLAHLRRRQDILTIVQGIEEACDRQDREAAQWGIGILNRMTRNELTLPVEIVKMQVAEMRSLFEKKKKEREPK